MYILRLANISRKYKIEDNKEKVVLNNISLMFPESGLVSIVGKSGSGKSTLINLISLMDEPSNGCIYYLNENIEKWSNKRKEQYRNKDIGIVFQNYHLLENHTALFNIMLPALIAGKSTKDAEIAAKSLLKSINFKENLYHAKCKDMSGGEKERIAILRALINNPRIILADEPTGALDSHNSIIIMDLLKQISEERLVILVSHNSQLVSQYSDEIITIRDGHIDSITSNAYLENLSKLKKEEKHSKASSWIKTLSKANFLRRLKRNIVSMASLVIGLVSSMLIIGFSNGSRPSIKDRSYHQLDYGVATLNKELVQSISGSKMNLVQMLRPTTEELNLISDRLSDFYVEPNTNTLLPNYPIIKCGEEKLEELSYWPIYSFIDSSVDRSLLTRGEFPLTDNDFEVLINKSAYEYLKDTFKSDPLNIELSINYDYEHHYYGGEQLNQVVTDYFIYDKNIRIVGVVDDFNFLTTPKIYYSYLSLKNYLKDTLLINLSEKMEADISWYDVLLSCEDNDALSSYSYRLFLKDYKNKEQLPSIIENIEKPLTIDSNAITISDTLFDLVDAATLGMELFLVIALIGTTLILGIISFSSYSEDKKTSAILTCLGANKNEIFNIYFYENLFVCGISLGISLVISPLLALGINKIIELITTFSNLISIPYLSFLGIPFLFPLAIEAFTFLVCLLSTYIPLAFSKKISPKEELMEE